MQLRQVRSDLALKGFTTVEESLTISGLHGERVGKLPVFVGHVTRCRVRHCEGISQSGGTPSYFSFVIRIGP